MPISSAQDVEAVPSAAMQKATACCELTRTTERPGRPVSDGRSGGCRRVQLRFVAATVVLPSSGPVPVKAWIGCERFEQLPNAPSGGRQRADARADGADDRGRHSGSGRTRERSQSNSGPVHSLGPRRCLGSGRRSRLPGVAAARKQSSGWARKRDGNQRAGLRPRRPRATASGLTQAATHAPCWGSVTTRRARAATPNRRRDRARTTKYPIRGLLHDFARHDKDFRRR